VNDWEVFDGIRERKPDALRWPVLSGLAISRRATKFELVINPKTARTLVLTSRQTTQSNSFCCIARVQFGTKRTSNSRSAMSAFGSKADVTISVRHVWF
jgi:hypothetical protein